MIVAGELNHGLSKRYDLERNAGLFTPAK